MSADKANEITEANEKLGNNRDAEFPIFAKWFDFVKWLLPLTDKLPKKVHGSGTFPSKVAVTHYFTFRSTSVHRVYFKKVKNT